MKLYIVTHGDKMSGANPGLASTGTDQIVRIREELLGKIPKPPLVVIGTGRRFEQTHIMLFMMNHEIPVKRSPFCGSADSLEKDGSIMLANGEKVAMADYIGLIGTPGFHAWSWLCNLPEGTLLCAGEELLTSLGLKNLCKKGVLIEVDTETQDGRQID